MSEYADMYCMTDRQLATISTIDDIQPIPKADAIEVATIRGWKVVVKKDEFQVGHEILYFEIDTLLPTSDPRFAFLEPRGTRTQNGTTGHVLRTVKLRGQISQGLILPLHQFPEILEHTEDDVTELLELTKWEPQLPTALAGEAVGYNPSWIPNTSATRIQNISQEELDALPKAGWQATEKLDGAAMWIAYELDTDNIRAGSRNIERKPPTPGTPFNEMTKIWQMVELNTSPSFWHELETEITSHQTVNHRIVLQGELVGPGVQSNRLGLERNELHIFRVLADGIDVPRTLWNGHIHKQTPKLTNIGFGNPQQMLEDANRKSLVPGASQRNAEGIVWRYYGTENAEPTNIKAISDKYLAKQKD